MPFRRNVLRTVGLTDLCGGSVVRVGDLVQLGVGRRTIARRCRPGGPWRWLLPGVVKLSNDPPTRDDYRRAALRYGGDGSVLTGLDALELHGMRRMPKPAGPVHLLVPADRRRSGAGRVLAERTDRLPSPTGGAWPLAPLPRAALDFCRRSRERDDVRAVLAELVQRGRCRPADLRAELEAGCGRGSALPRDVLRDVSDGVRSVAEADARRAVLASRLPRPLWNVRLLDTDGTLIAIPDAWFDDVGMAWEIDSHEWHLNPEGYDRTLDRRSAMQAHGVLVMHTQPSKLRRQRAEVIEELERNHAQAARRPRPPVTAMPAR
jgi:hypothetical protein